MYIFDTDHLSLIQRNGQEGKRILAKLAEIEDPEVAVTVITYEEQIRGRLAFLAKAKTLDEALDEAAAWQIRNTYPTYSKVPQVIKELKKYGRDDIMVIVGGVIPKQDYQFLFDAGAVAVFGPGTKISEAAISILEVLLQD